MVDVRPGHRGRSTRQRQAVLEALRLLCSAHPTADDVFAEVRKRMPSISLGTVYRNLRVLVDQGTIAELFAVESVRRYDGNTEPHAHVLCVECGRIADAQPPRAAMQEFVSVAGDSTGYWISGYRVELYGVCPDCRRDCGSEQDDAGSASPRSS